MSLLMSDKLKRWSRDQKSDWLTILSKYTSTHNKTHLDKPDPGIAVPEDGEGVEPDPGIAVPEDGEGV